MILIPGHQGEKTFREFAARFFQTAPFRVGGGLEERLQARKLLEQMVALHELLEYQQASAPYLEMITAVTDCFNLIMKGGSDPLFL